MAAPQRVRIIGGTFRGRTVPVVGGAGVRPTPDRVRETLFNWLDQDLTGTATLELYAGTGVLSLEALSRGATLAVAVDRSPALIASLRSVAERFGAAGLESHVGDALRHLRLEQRRFDVVFLDPPFDDDAWDARFAALLPRLAPGARVYAEAARALVAPPSLRVAKHARAGAVHYHLLTPIA